MIEWLSCFGGISQSHHHEVQRIPHQGHELVPTKYKDGEDGPEGGSSGVGKLIGLLGRQSL